MASCTRKAYKDVNECAVLRSFMVLNGGGIERLTLVCVCLCLGVCLFMCVWFLFVCLLVYVCVFMFEGVCLCLWMCFFNVCVFVYI